MQRLLRRLHLDDRAQDVLEFVLLTPFILFFIFTLVDFGFATQRWLVLEHATREGSRIGAVGKAEAEIIDRTHDQSQGLLPDVATACVGDDTCVEVTWLNADGDGDVGEPGDAIAVRARFKYNFLNPFLAWMPFDHVTLGSCADSRVEFGSGGFAEKGWSC